MDNNKKFQISFILDIIHLIIGVTVAGMVVWMIVDIHTDDKSDQAMVQTETVSSEEITSPDIIDTIDIRRRTAITGNTSPESEEKIRIETPDYAYEFTDMRLTCEDFVMDNNLWYTTMTNIVPSVAPGTGTDLYIRGDENERHYIKFHTVNTTDSNMNASDCTVFLIGIKGLEEFSIADISIGDKMEDIISEKGAPDAFSISDYDEVSDAVYHYGDFDLNITADMYGRVTYVEAVCTKDTENYRNGTIGD